MVKLGFLGSNPKVIYLEESLPLAEPRFPYQDLGRMEGMGLEGLYLCLGFILETSDAGTCN